MLHRAPKQDGQDQGRGGEEYFEQYEQLGDDLIWTNEEKAKTGLEILLRYPSIHVTREVEWMNVLFRYEVAKKYTLLCPETSAVLGHVEEESNGMLGWVARQVSKGGKVGVGPKACGLLVYVLLPCFLPTRPARIERGCYRSCEGDGGSLL